MRFWKWYSRLSTWTRRLLLLFVGLALSASVLWFTPTALYITAPGAAIDTSKLVSVPGGKPQSRLYMLIVTSQPANLFWYLYGKLDPRAQLETKEQFLGDIKNYQEYVEVTRQMMNNSRQTAAAVALQLLGYGRGVSPNGAKVAAVDEEAPSKGHLIKGDIIVEAAGKPVRAPTDLVALIAGHSPGSPVQLRVRRSGQELAVEVLAGAHPVRTGSAYLGVSLVGEMSFDLPIPVDITPGPITGPSAGLMFTLQIIDQLTPGGLARGLTIAGTGTVEWDGSVGAIGGVRQKVYTAEAAGAQVVFVPGANYDDARKAATRIEVVPVGHVRDALEWIRRRQAGTGSKIPVFWL